LAGWLIDALLEPLLGTAVTLFVSLVASTAAFFFTREWLKELRG
jgi:hypothetical protein